MNRTIFLLIMLVGIAPTGFAYTSGDTYVNALKNVSSKCQKMVGLNGVNELIMRLKLGVSATEDDYTNLITTDNYTLLPALQPPGKAEQQSTKHI